MPCCECAVELSGWGARGRTGQVASLCAPACAPDQRRPEVTAAPLHRAQPPSCRHVVQSAYQVSTQFADWCRKTFALTVDINSCRRSHRPSRRSSSSSWPPLRLQCPRVRCTASVTASGPARAPAMRSPGTSWPPGRHSGCQVRLQPGDGPDLRDDLPDRRRGHRDRHGRQRSVRPVLAASPAEADGGRRYGPWA